MPRVGHVAGGCEHCEMTSDPSRAMVHLVAGLNGAGKSTYARQLAQTCPAVRFTLDEWMIRLHEVPYDDPAYPDLREGCTDLIWDVAREVLSAGTDVILDWNQWSRARRKTWRDKALSAGHKPVLHYVRVPLETAIARVEKRAAEGVAGTHVLDARAVLHLASVFEVPTVDEGFEIRIVE